MKSCQHVFFFVKQDKFIKLNLSFSKQLSCSYTSKTGVYIFENSGGWGGDEKFDHLNFFHPFTPKVCHVSQKSFIFPFTANKTQ